MGDRDRERDRMGWQPRERDSDRRGSWRPPYYDNGPRPPTGYSHNRIDSWQPERDQYERGRREREHDRDRDRDRDHDNDRDYERRDRDWQGQDGAHGPNKRKRGGRRQKEKMAREQRDRERDRDRDGDHWEPSRPPQDQERRGGRAFPPPDAGYGSRVRQPSPIARPMRERSASPWVRRAPRSGPPSDGEITRSHSGSYRRSRSPRSPSRSRTDSVRGRGGSRSRSRSRTPPRNPSEMDTSAVIHEPYVLGSPSPPMEEPPALPPPPPPPQTSSYQRHELPPRPSLELPARPSTSQTASPAPHTMHHQLPPRPSVHIATASSSYVASPASASAPTPSTRLGHASANAQHQQHQQQQQQTLPPPRHSNVDPTTGLPIATTLANNPNRGKKPREGHNPYGSKTEEARPPPTAEELAKMRNEREDLHQRSLIAQYTAQISVRRGANTAALNRLMENKLKEIDLKHQIAVLGLERRVLALRKQLADEELARAQRGTWEDEIDMSWS